MRTGLKKGCACLLTVTMIVSLCACGKQEQKEEVDTKNITFREEMIDMEKLPGNISGIVVENGKAYVSTFEWEKNNNDSDVKKHLFEVALDGSAQKEIVLPESNDAATLQQFCLSDNGSIYYVESFYDEKADTLQNNLTAIDGEGKLLYQQDINKIVKKYSDSYVSGMAYDEKNGLLLLTNNACYIIDDKGSVKNTIRQAGVYLAGLVEGRDGNFYCGVEKTDAEGMVEVKQIHAESGNLTGEYPLNISYVVNDNFLLKSDNYDFYYADEAGIKGYDLATNQIEPVLDFVASDILDGYNICYMGDDAFLGTSQTGEDSKLAKYVKVDPSEIENKEVITLGAMYLEDNVKKEILDFNRTNDTYRIVYKDYSGSENPITKMNVDILSGNVPDILCLSDLPVELYAAKGLLEDLTPYMEKDEEVKKEDFLEPVLNAVTTDGKLYYMASSFDILTVMGAADVVGTDTGWTFEDLKKLAANKDEDTKIFLDNTKNDLLENFISYGYNDFVDWEKGSCSFDSEEFKALLEICNMGDDNPVKGQESQSAEEDSAYVSEIKNGKTLLVHGLMVSMSQYQSYRALFGKEVNCIGFPCEDKKGSYFYMNDNVGIYSKSKVKDGAWEFIRTLFTKEYQGKSYAVFFGGMPTRKDCFSMFEKTQTTTKEYTDEFGNEIVPIEYVVDMYSGEVVSGKPVSEEDVAAFHSLLENTTKVIGLDDAIIDIVMEEAAGYFAGDKSLDVTAEIIQNRANTYVNEIK